MTRRRGRLSDQDEALWRRVVATVRPLPGRMPPQAPPPAQPAGAAAPKPNPTPPPPLDLRIGGRAPPEPPLTVARPAAPDVPDRAGERRVRRGRLEIHASLDLHGMTQDRARRAVHDFLRRMAGEGGRVAIIVTGKGGRLAAGDASPGVLKRRLPDWLAERCDLVAGYAQAHRRHGGEGAFYVFVKRPPEKS